MLKFGIVLRSLQAKICRRAVGGHRMTSETQDDEHFAGLNWESQ